MDREILAQGVPWPPDLRALGDPGGGERWCEGRGAAGVGEEGHRGGGGSRRGSRNIGEEEVALVARAGAVRPKTE